MPEETDAAATYVLALEEGRRAVDQQREDLKLVRERATSLLTVAGVAAAFLGGLALRDKQARPGCWTVAGALAFVIIVGIVIWILWPRKIRFAQEAKQVIAWVEQVGLDKAAVARSLAYYHNRHYDQNREALEHMMIGYQVAIGLLAIEVVTLLLDLKGR